MRALPKKREAARDGHPSRALTGHSSQLAAMPLIRHHSINESTQFFQLCSTSSSRDSHALSIRPSLTRTLSSALGRRDRQLHSTARGEPGRDPPLPRALRLLAGGIAALDTSPARFTRRTRSPALERPSHFANRAARVMEGIASTGRATRRWSSGGYTLLPSTISRCVDARGSAPPLGCSMTTHQTEGLSPCSAR